jgi:hypothetical protein
MKAPRRLEGLEQRRGRFRDSLSIHTPPSPIKKKQSITDSRLGEQKLLSKQSKRQAHLDGFVWHTRHPARVPLRERKKRDCQLGLHLLCVWRAGRRCGREWAQDARVCAKGDEGCIRAYVRDDRI